MDWQTAEATIEPPGDLIPDHTASEPAPQQVPRQVADRVKTTIGKAGTNKKLRSPVRKTKPGELVQPVAKFYGILGLGLMPVRPQTGEAVLRQSMACATAVDNLARENDSVRRVILWAIESGIWGELLVAHLPIVWTLLPEEFVENAMPEWLKALFAAPSGQNGEVPEEMIPQP